jgi:hypothetical protein
VNTKITGRGIEVDIKEDYEGESNYLVEGQSINDAIIRVKWFNNKIRIILSEETKINYQDFVNKET